MSRLDNVLFKTESVKLEQSRLVHLVKLEIPYASSAFPGTTICIADTNDNVLYKTDIYTAFPFSFSGGFSHSSDGSVDKVTLECANPERMLMPYINNYQNLKGTTVTVYTIYEKDLITNPDGCVVDYFIVDSYTADDTTVLLMLDPSIDLNKKLPRGQFNSNSCRFRYKDTLTCKYAGPLLSCSKTLQDCKKHSVPFYSEFSPSVAYVVGSLVNYNNLSYRCILSTTAPFPAPTNTTYWAQSVVTKGTDTSLNSVFYGPSFPASIKPGYVIIVGGNTYTIMSVNAQIKLNGTSTIINNALIVSGASVIDAAGLSYQLRKGNQRNFGGFPGIPNNVRRLVL